MPEVQHHATPDPATTVPPPEKPSCPVCAQFPIDDIVWIKILKKTEYAAMRQGEVQNIPDEVSYESETSDGRFHCKGCKLTLFDNSKRIVSPHDSASPQQGTKRWMAFSEPFAPACLEEEERDSQITLRCQRCDSFIGQMDKDTSAYRVNSICVQFIPKAAPPAKTYPITKTEEEWRQQLNDTEYEILREAGTEPPDINAFVDIFDDGHYECKACGNDLFSSKNKFRATCGWPAFNQPMTPSSCEYSYDYKKGFRREECLCQKCGSHLGHRFYDAHDQESGMRYCINSTCLNFIADA